MAIQRKGYIRYSRETAIMFLQHFARIGSLVKSAALIGVGDTTVLSWVRDSSVAEDNQDTTSKFYFAGWPETEDADTRFAFFHRNYDLARKMYQMKLSQESAALVLSGYEEPVLVDGKQCWVEDEYLLAEFGGDREAAIKAGHHDPFFKSDALGARIPMMRKVMPSSQFLIAALRALAPNPWNVPDKRTLEVQQNISVYSPPTPRVQGPNVAIRDDLEERLRVNRAGLPALPALAAPAPREADDQPDDQNNRPPPAPSQVPEIAADLQRVLTPPQKHERPQTGDARPNRGEQIGYGKPPPGGYKAV